MGAIRKLLVACAVAAVLAGCSGSTAKYEPPSHGYGDTRATPGSDWPEIEQDQRELEGTWELVSGMRDGVDISDSIWSICRFARSSEKYLVCTQEAKDGRRMHFVVFLGSRTNPKRIDMAYVDGDATRDKYLARGGEPLVIPGIYEVQGDILKVCVPTKFNGKTPTSFDAVDLSGQEITVHRKLK
jgi:uncharacterized protein (TIGR03067 family)